MAAVAVAALIVYGSLLPFDLARPDTLNFLVWMRRIRVLWPLTSLTDLFVNVATGVPLGFFLTGVLRTRRRRWGFSAATVVVACVSAALGIVVESVQVFSATRQSEWNDVLGQLLGAALGVVAWALAGPWTMRALRTLAGERTAPRLAVHLLQFFLPIYLFLQLTPLVPTAMAPTYHGRSRWVPPTDHFEFTFPVLRNLAANCVINVPIGALAVLGWVRRRTRFDAGSALLLGVSLMAAVEVAQGLVWSRSSGIPDMVAGALGVAIGVAGAWDWSGPRPQSRRWLSLGHPWPLVAAAAWTLALAAQYWYPFNFQFTAECVVRRYFIVQLIPFKSYYPGYATAPLIGLHEIGARCLAGVPLGLMLRLAWARVGRGRVGFDQAMGTLATATIALVVIEVGQVFVPIPYEFPDVTDVILGVTGAAIGSAAAAALSRRRRASDAATRGPHEHIASGQRVFQDTARADGSLAIPP